MRQMNTYRIAALLIIVAACGLLSGCGKKETPSESAELMVLCGSSFVMPMEKLCTEFTVETDIKTATSVGGSEDLLPHVKLAEKGDVYVTHDPFLDLTRDANALDDHVHVGFVAPVLAVQKGNPKGIGSIEDVAKADLKVALTDPQYSTAGELVFALLEKKGIKEDVLKNAEVRAVLAPLATSAAKHRVAVVGISHLSKAQGVKAIYRTVRALREHLSKRLDQAKEESEQMQKKMNELCA